MKPIIITNNPKVYDVFFVGSEKGHGLPEVVFCEDMTQEEILLKARDMIHLGGRLIIHPMMGRIKPHETPYKSVFVEMPDEGEIAAETDFMSVTIIEDSISETRKLLNDTYMLKYDETMLEDLQYLDYLLIRNGLEEYR